MDIISLNEASTANGRIEKFIENPDSTSGIVTIPKTIASGETVTIPAGRVAVLPNVQVDGTLNVEGEVFIPSGATFGDLESQIALKADTSYVNNKYSGFKNYIINGNFDVDQYGIGSQQNWPGNYYYTDRFLVLNSSTVVRNGAGNNNPTGFTNHLSVTKTAGVDTQIIQRWEIPKDKAKMFLNGRTLTFSCWVLSDINNFIESMFFNKNGTTANAYEIKVFSITKNNTAHIWTRITATITNIQWAYEAGDYIEIRLDLVNDIAGALYMTGWQLEEGSVATPFENRPYGLELSLCQRYYETGYVDSIGYGNGFVGQYIYFNTAKRTTPTITQTNNYTSNCSATTANDSISLEGFRTNRTTTVAGNYEFTEVWTASAEI